ncbi:MAG: hypothetical protein RMX35_02535 [Nostoc sp. DcaGUA01]|nr:hypothetical protein [Nostoc sp. DcaGUA01]
MFFTKILPFQLSSSFSKEEIISLREKQDRTLEADVKSVLDYRAWIQTKTHHTVDNTRILGIVATTQGAENYLPYTIPKIIQQISETGMMADIVIGLNNGFECPVVIEKFALLSDVQVVNLYTAEKLANNIPALIFDNVMCQGEPYYLNNMEKPYCRHRIFVVHQKEGKYSAGKIRILGDIYGSLLLKSIEHGWIPPAILVAFDAESIFLANRNYSVIEPESNGLKLIVNHLQNNSEIDILGTRNKFAVYQKTTVNESEILLPNFSEELSPIHWFIDIVHGRFSGYQYKPASGTVGKTDALVSVIAVIAERYPGIKSDDTHITILAKYARFVGDIFMDVISTNRTPHLADMTMEQPPKKAWKEQLYRWSTANRGLKLLYGEHNIKLIVSYNFPWFILTEPIQFWKPIFWNRQMNLYIKIKKIIVLASTFFTYWQINIKSRKNPDTLKGNGAKAFW